MRIIELRPEETGLAGSYRRKRAQPLLLRQSSKSGEPRGSRHDRGYDAEWVSARDPYLRSVHGRCEECARRGYLRSADVVDHIIPVRLRRDLRLDRNNLDALCHGHHNGWKRRLEEYAIKSGCVEMLPVWVKCPDMRPAAFRLIRYGPLKDMLDAEAEQGNGGEPEGSDT